MTFSKLGTDTETNQTVYLPKSARLQGLYIIGLQGMGKSGLIENLIMQDIDQQIGVCILDPHGELIDHVLARLETKNEKDVILLDINDYQYPFGLNIFTCSDLTNPLEFQRTVDQVKHIFEKLLGVSTETRLILEYLHNCTHTLIVNPGYTMAEIPLMLQDGECRKKLVAKVTDPDVSRFWRRYEQMKPSEQDVQAAPLLRRVQDLLQPLTRPIVGQAKTTIDFRRIMDDRKILLVKLDRRLEDTTTLIGSMMVALILNASASRQTNKQFHLYADEFQRFATEDFATLLEEARKAGIGITMAHQNRSQLELSNKQADANLKARTLNVGSLVVFRVPTDADELAGQFDTTPPPAREEDITLIDGTEPIETPVQDVIGHLKNRGSHANPSVTRFIYSYQKTIEQYLQQFLQVRHQQGYSWWFKEEPIREAEKMLNCLNDLLYEANVNKNPYVPFSFDTINSLAEYLRFPTCFSFFYEMATLKNGYMFVNGELIIVDASGYQALLSILAASDPTQPAISNAWNLVVNGVRNIYTNQFLAPLTSFCSLLNIETYDNRTLPEIDLVKDTSYFRSMGEQELLALAACRREARAPGLSWYTVEHEENI